MMGSLENRRCAPCRKGTPPLKDSDINRLLAELGGGWRAVSEHHLEKDYAFKNFVDALAFVNRIGAVAESEGHHPDLLLSWGKVKVTLFTHKIDGLSENDFILAAKCDGTLQTGVNGR